MSPPFTIHGGTVLSNTGVKLAGRVQLLPHPVRDQKKEKKKLFSYAVCTNSFSQVSVPQIPKSVSFLPEPEQEQRGSIAYVSVPHSATISPYRCHPLLPNQPLLFILVFF